MKRQIMFRGWDKHKKEMTTFFDISADGEVFLPRVPAGITYLDHVIMQYTGICDKNQKYIYELDIVQAHDTTYKIIFANGSFGGIRGGRFCHINNMYCEVIGNVFENPELVPPHLSFSKT